MEQKGKIKGKRRCIFFLTNYLLISRLTAPLPFLFSVPLIPVSSNFPFLFISSVSFPPLFSPVASLYLSLCFVFFSYSSSVDSHMSFIASSFPYLLINLTSSYPLHSLSVSTPIFYIPFFFFPFLLYL